MAFPDGCRAAKFKRQPWLGRSLFLYEIESMNRNKWSDVTGKMETFNDLSGLMMLIESPPELMISILVQIS